MKRKTVELNFDDTSDEDNFEPVLKKMGRPSNSKQTNAKKIFVSTKKTWLHQKYSNNNF
jgi:hypothetical protein